MDSHDDYYEEAPEFKNPQSAEFFQIKSEIFREHQMGLENGDYDEDETQNDELFIQLEEALESYLTNFVKHGLTQRGDF